MAAEWCLDWADWLCSTPTSEIPFWELLLTLTLTAAVTVVTILSATRSAREATAESLKQSRALHIQAIETAERHAKDAIDAAERQAAYQSRVREAILLGRLVRAHFAETMDGLDPSASARVRGLREDAAASLKPSLTPGAPQIHRIIEFELDSAPLKSEVTTESEQDVEDWLEDLAMRREDALERIEDWSRDPGAVLPGLIERAKRIALVDVLDVTFGPVNMTAAHALMDEEE